MTANWVNDGNERWSFVFTIVSSGTPQHECAGHSFEMAFAPGAWPSWYGQDLTPRRARCR